MHCRHCEGHVEEFCQVCGHVEEFCQACGQYEDVCQVCKIKTEKYEERAKSKRNLVDPPAPKVRMQEKQDSTCKHTEDVCQHCLEKVETTTEDSPPKDTLPSGAKLLLTPIVSSFLLASGAIWVASTKMFYTAAKMVVKLIGTPTE